jgi:drug/metabolite transporter (DMT)-like permease
MVAILSYIDPITTLMLGALVLQEPMTATQCIGAVIVLGSTLAGKLTEAV